MGKIYKKRIGRSLILTFLAAFVLFAMPVSTHAAGGKTPGKVTVTRVRLAGSENVTVYWKKPRMLQTTGFIINRQVPSHGKELQP